MATRGSLGGLSRAAGEAARLLDAFGMAWVLIETVGVGQTELDIAKLADTTVVVLVPESGDAIQTMKAGLLEVADIFVVNKADRAGAPALVTELRLMAHLHREGQQASRGLDWEVPVVATAAVDGTGVEVLLGEIVRHRQALQDQGALERRRQARRGRELRELMASALAREVERALADGGPLAALAAEVEAGRVDPYTAIARIRDRLRASAPGSS
jgi:LAO/AO transport system kinase